MRRWSQVIRLDPDYLDEYRDFHDHIWPEVAANLKKVHINNYSIHYAEGFLFSYLEYDGTDMEGDFKNLASCPENIRWRNIMKEMQLPFGEGDAKGVWTPMEEIFYLK